MKALALSILFFGWAVYYGLRENAHLPHGTGERVVTAIVIFGLFFASLYCVYQGI
jgi:hypothetical protein